MPYSFAKENFALILRFVLAVGITTLFGVALFHTGDIPDIMLGALVAITTQVWAWFFGSSKGSSDKTSRLLNGGD